MKHWFPISIILVLYVALAATYSVITPLGEGPDEPGHAAYVFFLAREGRLPDQRTNEVPGEGHQPPLAYALAAPALLWLPREARTFDLPGNSRFVWAGGDQVNAAAHGTREFWPWRGEVLAWHMARLVSVVCGAVTVALTYLIACTISDVRFTRGQIPPIVNPKSKIQNLPLLAAALVAFNPQFLFVSGLASNDAMLAALSTLALWLCVRQPTAGDWRMWASLRYGMLLGAVLGLALLTKQSALVLVPVMLLALVARSWQRGDLMGSFGRAAIATCGLVGASVAVSGWWFLRNLQLYGDMFGLAAFQAEFTTQAFDIGSIQAWRDALLQLHASFWARFGWMNVYPPRWAIAVFAVVEFIGLTGGLIWAMRRWRNQKPNIDSSDRNTFAWGNWLLMALLIATTFAWVVAFARTAGLVAWQGRLMFPAIAAIAVVLAAGLQQFALLLKRDQAVYAVGMPLFLLALWLPFGVIRPAYPPQALPERAAMAWTGNAASSRFAKAGDKGAELRGWRLEGEVRPGSRLQLVLLWHALARQNRDWAVFIHLVDANEQIVAEDNREPRDGMFPMGQWVAGDWVEDTHPLQLPANLARGSYTLRVGLFDAKGTEERTGVWDAKGKLRGDYLELGVIDVR